MLAWSGRDYSTSPCRSIATAAPSSTDTARAPATARQSIPTNSRLPALKNYAEAADKIIEEDSNDLSKWEHISTIPMRFNRLVLLRPWFYHTAGPSFGNRIENGRLVHLFFFEGVG